MPNSLESREMEEPLRYVGEIDGGGGWWRTSFYLFGARHETLSELVIRGLQAVKTDHSKIALDAGFPVSLPGK
ncbi:hypothetical protein BCON_0132g00070 [Botryotinia convoluta]|uniref:Uncharacterized protein n=1 Tax=Botryotinia convoluta TaxID=54673 RepID=A0A4Z1I2L3_9HELO|nr:hypothetical protein BCON_0132g00070 [Botryotinia convoluta]